MKSLAKCFSEGTNKIKKLYFVGFVMLAVAFIFGIFTGSTRISAEEVLKAFSEGFSSSAGARIFFYVRLPRVLAALICGAALSVAGVVIQNVLANPLASPGIIGVNAGAGLAVTFCTVMGIYGGVELSIISFLGAFLSVMLISIASKKWGASKSMVILMGVALNSLLGAFSDALITFAPEAAIMSNDFKIGEFSAITYSKLIPSLIIICVTIIIVLSLSNELDILSLGDDNAGGLGMNTPLVRTILLMLAAILAGCAVSIAGLLSFVGLIVPHTMRRVSHSSSFHLIGLCALFGSSFVCICDTLARTLFTPYEIPVGIIMAFLGAPFFVFILLKRKGDNPHA